MAEALRAGFNARLQRERRKNRRLRAIIDELRRQVQRHQQELDVQLTRLAQIQAEVDALKGRVGEIDKTSVVLMNASPSPKRSSKRFARRSCRQSGSTTEE